MISRLVLALAVAASIFGGVSAPAVAAVDTWRVLHVGLESFPASDDTDGDGVVNTWGGSQGQTVCKPRGKSGKEKCTTTPGTVTGSPLYQAWQADISCFEPTVEAWSDYQIDIYQESVFIQTNQPIDNNPYAFIGSGLAAQYGFEAYDVVMVWTAYTQATGWDGGTWNADALGTGYSYVGLYGLYGQGCPATDGTSGWPAYVPAHEFVHTVTGLYHHLGYPVCGTYEYNYWQFGEWEGHHKIMTNTFPATVCSTTGLTSTGIPPEAFASGSWQDHY